MCRAYAVDPNRGAECVLALVRALLAVFSIAAIFLDAAQQEQYRAVANLLLAGVAVCSVGLLGALRSGRQLSFKSAVIVQTGDVVVVVVLMLLTESPLSPFRVYLTFAVLAGAYRWGLRGAAATAVGLSALLVAIAVPMSLSGRNLGVLSELEWRIVLVRCTRLALLAAAVGLLAEQERNRSLLSDTLARMLARLLGASGLSDTLQVAAEELFASFGGRSLRLIAHDLQSNRLFGWSADRPSKSEPSVVRRLPEIDAGERDGYLFDTPSQEWLLLSRSNAAHPQFDLVYQANGPVSRIPFTGLSSDLASLRFDALAASTLRLGDAWHIRLFIVDPDRADLGSLLSRLRTVVGHMVPPIYAAYLVGRLRSRASAIERGRLARELHDGVVQSLVAVRMRLDAVRRCAVERCDPIAAELATMESLIRTERGNRRELTERSHDNDVRGDQVVDRLEDLVHRFRRETGIAAQFTSDLDRIDVPPSVCHELLRIAQEALANVRRHSGAEHARVRLARNDDGLHLSVEDDGAGMGFEGRRDHIQVLRDRRPRVIAERARIIGAQLTIDSQQGRGTRLEVVLPQRRAAQSQFLT
jgi:signal transduction histidine kinase